MKIVKVTWIDAQRIELGVQQLEEIKEIEPIPCDIVGFEVCQDKNKIIIAQEKWDDLSGFKYIHVIPKCSIQKIEILNNKNKEVEENGKNKNNHNL